jgi:anti-sigma B factor antagonist
MERGSRSGSLEIAVSQSDGARLVRLTGEFDLAGVDGFERKLQGEPGSQEDTLVLDLSGLTFIDSSGLRAVVMVDHRVRAEGKRCLIVRGTERVERVLELTGVSERLELVDRFPG